jgi:hypothetical protein
MAESGALFPEATGRRCARICTGRNSPVSSNDGSTSRRDFLASTIALAPAAAFIPGRATAQSAVGDVPQSSAPAPNHPAANDYRPQFFTPAEWAFINAACARLIPADEHGPGALELGVPQYIDRQLGTPVGGWRDLVHAGTVLRGSTGIRLPVATHAQAAVSARHQGDRCSCVRSI